MASAEAEAAAAVAATDCSGASPDALEDLVAGAVFAKLVAVPAAIVSLVVGSDDVAGADGAEDADGVVPAGVIRCMPPA
ncbi:MAG TPA: hypothetical protein VH414_13520 [Lichenihabitans sp.]|jgi:hypothetical protein|nr:hypothetical protein [Lichenihabitans sp.]